MQIVLGVAFVIILLAMAGYFAWQQLRARRTLQTSPHLDADERAYLRGQIWRRLACSGLMVVLAGMLGTSFYLEGPANQLVREGEANQERGERPPLAPEQERFVTLYSAYWAVFLLILLAVVLLAGVDFFAIHRYGQRQLRRIHAARKAMLEGELTRLRSQRNGHS